MKKIKQIKNKIYKQLHGITRSKGREIKDK